MRPTQQTTYDYSQLILAAKKESQYKDFSSFIDEKIHQTRDRYYDGEARSFNRFTLANMIGIDPSTLTKIINRSQGTRKRDIIIALCFALQLSESETTQALNLYPMAPLNPNNLRDLVIIHALHDGVSVRQLDDILTTHGFPQLNILRGDRKSEDRSFYYPHEAAAYEEISVDVLPYCVAGDDSDRSLDDRYRPDRYDYHSKMIIQRKGKDGPQYRISRDDYGEYEIELREGDEWKCLYTNDQLRQMYENVGPCKDPELLIEITRLKEYTDRRARYVHSMCNDTRNYGSRFDAINDHGRLMLYGEGFGFDAPELSEYFQLEVSSDSCLFTVSNTSKFLERYLGPEAWMKLYGTLPVPIVRSFTTLDEIPNQRWRAQFQALLQGACDLLDQLRDRRLFIFNARAWIDIDQLMHAYHVEDAFECYQPDDMPYEIVPKKDQITGPDGNPVTVDDLYRASELGISTLEDLCAIRTRCGSLEQFLQINALTKQKGNTHE